jgi:hypothetical protein
MDDADVVDAEGVLVLEPAGTLAMTRKMLKARKR